MPQREYHFIATVKPPLRSAALALLGLFGRGRDWFVTQVNYILHYRGHPHIRVRRSLFRLSYHVKEFTMPQVTDDNLFSK